MYSEHLIAFIDILGYSELVAQADFDEVDRCVRIFLDAFAARDPDQWLGRRTTYFSDTIVTTIPVIHPKSGPQLHGLLFHEINALCLAQADLFDRLGVIVRGGLTVGNLIHDETRIFGPAVIQAYKLEQSASFPRIVVDRRLFTRYFADRALVASHHIRRAQDYSYIRPLLYRESNGDRSVDYLGQALHNLDDPDYYPVLLEKHRDLIRNGLAHHSSSVRAKYLWLTRYHDHTVRRTMKPEFRERFMV
ncbi:MAG TPA: hypothetical protein VFG14_06120 [Chthoniobacteraceae bacterium]|jgi:hypothetical protein|nr:hypothetical protein [Chthoniobacteraceae bacterium]